MSATNSIQSIMETTLETIKNSIDSNTIVGNPIEAEESIIVPISKVTVGFGIGGGEYNKNNKNYDTNFAGGSGGAITISPVAFVVVENGETRLLSLEDNINLVDNILTVTPRIIEKVQRIIKPEKSNVKFERVFDDKDKEEYATKVGMKQFLDREPHHLSGGEKQRVAIAGVLALGAKIIILDEATAMLDPQGRENMMELVHELAQDEDKTIIMITHHLDEAVKSDRIVVMNAGQIILEGTPKEVFAEKELLESVKLDVPFAVKASYDLKQKGILSEICTSDEELMGELCKLNLNQ